MTIILPDELTGLQKLPQWVAFKLIMNEQKGKLDKVPYDPKTGRRAKANDPATWATYDEAVAFADRRGYFDDRTGGIGFEFANGIAGVDLDGVILPDGTLKSHAREIVERMNSYTEISPSGKGLHILFRMTGSMSDIGPRRRNDELGVEAYSEGRYFTITGHVYGEVKPIAERTDKMKAVYEKYMAKPEKAEAAKSTPPLPPTVDTYPQTILQGERVPSEDLSDDELWERMRASEKGGDIQALYNGDISGYTRTHQDGNTYPDHSAADMAMCLYLAYWTGNDAERIDRMFRQTRLYRDKWERTDYRERTISEAIRLTPIYVPAVRDTVRVQATTREKGNASPLSVSPVAGAGESVPTEGSRQGEVMRADSWTPPMTGYDYVASGTLRADLVRFQKYPDINTGFQNFDEAQGGLSSGLYVLGATPSLGKTTLLVQMADNIAKSGNAVLYFSLEQSRLELTTKSISRLTAQHGTKDAVSAINIRRGQYTNDAQREAVKRAVADYQEFSANISIVELGLDATIATITDTVSRYIDYTSARPVVMVDYLQILRPDNEKLATRDAVDYAVKVLKKLQVDNNLVVMVISSFNRTNYLTPVDYESFKETGGIEYTADVLLGLQPQIMTDDLFNNEKKVKEKREAVDKALSAIPRRVMLKNLKNRFGRKGYACGFTYDPRFDLFIPDKSFKVVENEQTAVL